MDQRRGQGGHRNGQRNRNRSRRRSSSSNQTWPWIAIVAVIFYFSIDDRLKDKIKEPNLFDSFEGPWADNNVLLTTEKVLTDHLYGPESLAKYKGNLYTGISNGQIVRIEGVDKVSKVVQFGDESCANQHGKKACGRPLGIRVTSSGDLYTIDGLNGLIKVTNIDGTSGQPEFKLLFNISSPVDGNSSAFLDDLVIDESDGDKIIYITDASSLWDLNDCVAAYMDMDDSGRILRYTESTGSIDVVLSGLAFPNGIELTDSKDALLIGEFTHRRILKYYLTGPSKGTTEVLINLPGEPDNIRRSARSDVETYWIAVFSPRTKKTPSSIDYYSERPFHRKFMITFYRIIGTLYNIIGVILNSDALVAEGELKSSLWSFVGPNSRSMALEIDSKGNVINFLHSNDGYFGPISEIHDEIDENGRRTLYLGSFTNNYLGVLTLES